MRNTVNRHDGRCASLSELISFEFCFRDPHERDGYSYEIECSGIGFKLRPTARTCRLPHPLSNFSIDGSWNSAKSSKPRKCLNLDRAMVPRKRTTLHVPSSPQCLSPS